MFLNQNNVPFSFEMKLCLEVRSPTISSYIFDLCKYFNVTGCGKKDEYETQGVFGSSYLDEAKSLSGFIKPQKVSTKIRK